MTTALSPLPITNSSRLTVAHLIRDETYGLMRHAHNLSLLEGMQSIFVAPAAAEPRLAASAFVPSAIPRRPSWATVREANRIADELQKHRPDLLHSHAVATLPAALIIARRLAIPLVHSPHALPVPGLSGSRAEVAVAHGLLRLAAARGVSFVAVSRGEADAIRRVTGRESPVDLVVNPVPPRYLDPWPRRQRGPVVVSLSRFWKQKSPELTVDVMAALQDLRPDAHLMWAGDGPLFEECCSRAAAAGVVGRIDFLGPIPDSLAVLHEASVMLSTSSFEAMPYAVLEAMAAGAAVVATDIPAHAEIDGGLGAISLCPPSAGELARAVARLLSNDIAHAGQRQRARKLVERQHSMDVFQERMLGVYRRLVSGLEPVPIEEPAIEVEALEAA